MQRAASAQDAFEQREDDVDAHDSDYAPENDIDDLSNERDSNHSGQKRHKQPDDCDNGADDDKPDTKLFNPS
jgi:hypothetical protein